MKRKVPESDAVIPGRLSYVHTARDLLSEIRARPALWLNDKSLTGLKDLLFGYEIACRIHHLAITEPLDDVTWQGFTDWLQARYNKSATWYQLLIENSRSESEAFDRFFEFLDAYEDVAYESVHAVEDYYDGPRVGIANFQGVEHRFRSVGWVSPDGPDEAWDPQDDQFELTPIGGDGKSPIIVRGIFRVREPVPTLPPGILRPLEVRWILPSAKQECRSMRST